MKVLVVDDSVAMRLMVKRMLRVIGLDDNIIEADDGDKALEMIKSSKPDLVLSDWNMPTMTGIELLHALNEAGITPTFGFITTEASATMRAEATEAGAKFLISKPFTEESFRSALQPFM